jgi:hypothetical protein
MSQKTIIWIGVIVGSTIGGYIPTFFGSSFLSLASLIGNTIGGFVGLYLAYKFTS